jgi:1-acyl-sn-glycerol-3-phosphate acyltransferase
MFPLLLLFTSSEKYYPAFFVCARIWAKIILFGMGFFPKKKSDANLQKGRSYMFVANHSSMTDIMLMLSIIKHPFVFVGKQELAKIPLFGFFYRRSCILVNRQCAKSRMDVFEEAQRRLKQGNSICIFPEGGVPDEDFIDLAAFKDGAFRLAIEHQIPVVPITMHDNKKRFPYKVKSGKPGVMRAKVHKEIPTVGMSQADKRKLKQEAYEIILKELKNPSLRCSFKI